MLAAAEAECCEDSSEQIEQCRQPRNQCDTPTAKDSAQTQHCKLNHTKSTETQFVQRRT
jgi:hypothetical protein